MTGPSANMISGGESADASNVRLVKSRFGDVAVDLTKVIVFGKGLLGMPDKAHFALAEFPNPGMQQFKLLQSLDDTNLSFIVLPIDLQNRVIEQTDLEQTASLLSVPVNDLAVLVIVSVHRTPEGIRISVNARAPLFVDASKRAGVQFVFHHDKYKVQQYLE